MPVPMNDGAAMFFHEIVEPTVAEFLSQTDDKRRGCLACLSLSAMADHYFHARPEGREGCSDANRFRWKVGEINWAVGQVNGVANATKHVERRQGRVGYQDVSSQQITVGNLRVGWPVNGTQIIIEVEHGNLWLLSQLVEVAMTFWRNRLAM